MLLVEQTGSLRVQQVCDKRTGSKEGIRVIIESLELPAFGLVGNGAQKTDLGCRRTEPRARGDKIWISVAEGVGSDETGRRGEFDSGF